MDYPKGLKYSREHEWLSVENDNAGVIGITDFAQNELGEVVYVEAPKLGETISKDDPFGAVESVKAVSDLYAPVSGTVTEVNETLPDNPELINEEPYGEGWIVKVAMSDVKEMDDLMTTEEYVRYCEGEQNDDDS